MIWDVFCYLAAFGLFIFMLYGVLRVTNGNNKAALIFGTGFLVVVGCIVFLLEYAEYLARLRYG